MIQNKVTSKCCGCYACSNVCPKNAIDMKEDEDGFKYPIINKQKCIECGLCKNVCPIINKMQIEDRTEAYACINNNETIRKQSSSGGIFSLIAEEVLNEGGVVFGAKFDNKFDVVHSFVEEKDDLKQFRGSKYVQSQIKDCYRKAKAFLETGRYVLFTGTPCQIAGLHSYLQNDYQKLYTQDIVCHGVPSPTVWKKYIESIEKNSNSKIENINFRDKTKGWMKYLFTYTLKNGKQYKEYSMDNKYMKAFLNDLSIRESCSQCSFRGKNRRSDITLADFWGINYILPKMNDNKGTSLVIISTEKGKRLFEKIKNKMKYEKVNIEDAIKYNPSITVSVNENPKRTEFFDMLSNSSFDRAVNKCIPEENIIKKIMKKVLRKITETIK